jgi:hypothetical protein
VRRRVLWSKVQRVILDIGHDYHPCPYDSSRITRGTISRGSIVTGW